MGLQRLFSATTAIVGLFISVDYGLCDEFRCRGHNTTLPAITNNVVGGKSENDSQASGWQGRAVWTLVYIAGIALWTLHLSLLEGHVLTSIIVSKSVFRYKKYILISIFVQQCPPNKNNCDLLSTVSRIVSSSEPTKQEPPKIKRNKPKLLHIAFWIHAISWVVTVFLGWIDIIPGQGSVSITLISSFLSVRKFKYNKHVETWFLD